MRSRRQLGLVAISAAIALTGAVGGAFVPQSQPAAKQPENLTEARKALAGKWLLVSLTVHAVDGRSALVEATGTLVADFSNMSVEFQMTDKGLKALADIGVKSPNPVISTSGRVLIETGQRQISYVGDDFHQKALGFDPELAKKRANPFALERTRYYTFNEDGTLRLATRHDNGKDASVSVWKRAAS